MFFVPGLGKMKHVLLGHIHLWTLVLLAFTPWSQTTSSRILIVPTPHGSDIAPLFPVTKILREKYNHESTFVLPPYMLQNPLVKGMQDNIITAENMNTFNFQEFARNIMIDSITGVTPVKQMLRAFTSSCDLIFTDLKLIDELQKGNFSILILHNFLYADCMNLIAYKLSIPYIVHGNFYEPINNGIPHNPATVPDFPFTDYSSDMTFFQRLQNIILYHVKSQVLGHTYNFDVSSKYVPEKPYISIRELRSQVQLNLLEFDVLMDYLTVIPRKTEFS